MQIRQLERDDAPPYRVLRLRMLHVYPDAFTSSYGEDSLKPLAWAEKRITPGKESPHDFVLGAYRRIPKQRTRMKDNHE